MRRVIRYGGVVAMVLLGIGILVSCANPLSSPSTVRLAPTQESPPLALPELETVVQTESSGTAPRPAADPVTGSPEPQPAADPVVGSPEPEPAAEAEVVNPELSGHDAVELTPEQRDFLAKIPKLIYPWFDHDVPLPPGGWVFGE